MVSCGRKMRFRGHITLSGDPPYPIQVGGPPPPPLQLDTVSVFPIALRADIDAINARCLIAFLIVDCGTRLLALSRHDALQGA